MRALLLALALSTAACAGGQTGEITMLGMCDDARALGGLEVLDDGERARLDEATAEFGAELVWELEERTEATTITITATPRDGDVEEVGREACTRLRVPVDIDITTDDGRIDLTLAGAATLYSTGDVTLRGDAPVTDNGGDLDLDWLGPLPEGTYYAEIDRSGADPTGQIFVAPGGEQDEVRLAAF